MTLKLLLDEQISPDVADWFRGRHGEQAVFALAGWEQGRFMGQADHLLFDEAAAQGLTLVTYDRRTIPPLLKTWAETGRDHGGVIFVDQKTIPPSDFGGLIRALQEVFRQSSNRDWTNRVCFLRR